MFEKFFTIETIWDGWMDDLGFYVPSTVFQSFRDDNLGWTSCFHARDDLPCVR